EFKGDCNNIKREISDKIYFKLEKSNDVLNKWVKFFNSNKELSENIVISNLDKINDYRVEVNKILDNIDNNIKMIQFDIENITSIDDIKNLQREINKIEYHVRGSKYEKMLFANNDLLQDIIIDFNEINVNLRDRVFLNDKIIDIKSRYSGTILENVMLNKIDEIEGYLEKLEIEYISDIQKNIVVKINNMNYSECIQNINKLSNKPLYLSQKGIKEIDKIIDLLQVRLNDNKIDTIVHMFKELDENNKKKCLAALLGL
ncbi:MAG: hypothetical protein SPD90_03040, partial [Intestinibacter sp.]|uniref:hypothetical protein n=1 Tax=Intestinibacter sp. TaxID=1965304 RepID=UPI002A82B154